MLKEGGVWLGVGSDREMELMRERSTTTSPEIYRRMNRRRTCQRSLREEGREETGGRARNVPPSHAFRNLQL